MRNRYGRYEVLYKLGQGAMAEVFIARDPILSRFVAIKVIHKDLAQQPAVLKRFFQEARIVALVRSPHVVEVFDFGEEENTFFLVMEFVDGMSLQGILNQVRILKQSLVQYHPMPPLVAVALLCQAAEGLEVAAKNGIVHRDLKPENMMLNQQGYLKITDFGIAHVQDDSLTKTGSILGSPLFMSPEQVFGLKSISSQADIFSLGAVFYTCLVGVHPFNGKNLPELYRKISLEPHIPAGHWLPSLDPALNRLVDLLLHKDPKQRGGGPKWLHRQLKAYLLAKEISEPTECVSEYLKDLSSKGLHTTWGLEIKSQRTQHATLKSSPQMEGTLHFSREDNQKWSSGIFVSLLVAFFLMAVGIGFGIKEFHLFNQASSTQPSKGVALQLSQVESVARPSELAARQSRSALKPVLSELSISSISNPSSKNPSPALEDSSLALTPKEAQVSQLNLSELKFAVLSLYSSPPFREVYLDGKFAGVTPFVTGSLSIGEHHFVSKSEGWRSIDTVLILGPGTQSLKLKFEDGKLPVLAGNSEE